MIIDGKKIAAEIQEEIKKEIASLPRSASFRPPCLAVLLVGDHPASTLYVKRKTEACEAVGIRSIVKKIKQDISLEHLLQELEILNQEKGVDGILVQLPLPSHIPPGVILQHITPEKDVDGFHPINMGKLLTGEKGGFVSCTPLGIKTLMERSSIEVAGKHVVIIGRSNIVGKPMAALLMQTGEGGNATVTVAHSHTKNMKELTLQADIIIVAIGSPLFLKEEMVKEGSIVIDVGINKIPDPTKAIGYKIVGDVDFERVAPKCLGITPVPGGVGPMTIAMLLKNTLKSYQRKN